MVHLESGSHNNSGSSNKKCLFLWHHRVMGLEIGLGSTDWSFILTLMVPVYKGQGEYYHLRAWEVLIHMD